MHLEQLKRLAAQASDLHESLYNRSMDAAIQGNRDLSDRLYYVALKAFKRYERRHHAFSRAKAGTSPGH